MTWTVEIEERDGGRVRRYRVFYDGSPLSYAETIVGWRSDDAFRGFFLALLAEAPFDAYLWETPPIRRSTATRAFEFVLVESTRLAGMAAERGPFSEHFANAADAADVAIFANLGGDAWLVAPMPRAATSVYPHLAAFSRGAPSAQQHAFWQVVGAELESRLGDAPLWLSTNGLGVGWLHARLDARPKYYAFRPYRTEG